MVFMVMLVITSFYINTASAMDDWFCKEGSAKIIGNDVYACGSDYGFEEQDAKARAINQAIAEFDRLCISQNCIRNKQRMTVRPGRTECRHVHESRPMFFSKDWVKCVRLVIFQMPSDD
jgi:hypothetical protein